MRLMDLYEVPPSVTISTRYRPDLSVVLCEYAIISLILFFSATGHSMGIEPVYVHEHQPAVSMDKITHPSLHPFVL